MTYDTPITICRLPDGVGTLMQGQLVDVLPAFCGKLEVYHARFWESVQAGSSISELVQLPLHRREADAGLYAKLDGHVYSIVQAQFGKDENQMPITTLSLKREEAFYDPG